jgi:hypothetical protein
MYQRGEQDIQVNQSGGNEKRSLKIYQEKMKKITENGKNRNSRAHAKKKNLCAV